jgi:phage antirepressor YoqD-like protein
MKKFIILNISFIVLLRTLTFAQGDDRKIFSMGFWNFSSIYGEFRFGGMFHQGGMSSQDISDFVKTRNYYGGIQLNTNSYIWSPNFITIGINGNYSPSNAESKRQLFNNRYDLVDSKNLNLNMSLLPTKKFTLNGFASFSDNYDNRENLTDLRNVGKTIGTSLALKNKRLPVFLSYSNSLYEQQELTTIHKIVYNESAFTATASKSYTSRNKTDITYTNKTYCRAVDTFANVINNLQTAQIRNTIFLDSIKNTRLSTDIYGLRECGVDSFDQIRINESFNKRLKNKVQIASNYSFFFTQNTQQCFRQNQVNAVINKQFFESLTLGVNGEYNKADQTDYNDWFMNMGYNITYSKRILRKNYLTVSYNYNLL